VALAAAQSTASAIEGLAGDEEEIDRLEGDLVARRGLGNAERTALHGFTGREREEAQPRMAALDAGEGAAKAPRRERLEDREGVELPGQGKVERDRRAGPGLHEGREREEPFLRKEGAAGDLVRGEGGAQAIDGRAERALFVEAWLHRRKKESPALAVWEHPSNPASAGGGRWHRRCSLRTKVCGERWEVPPVTEYRFDQNDPDHEPRRGRRS